MIFVTRHTQSTPTPIPVNTRVLVYDRSELMRVVLSQFVGSQPDLTICGTAAAPKQVIEDVRRLEPDVVVLGLSFERPQALLRLVADVAGGRVGAVLVLSRTDRDPSAAGVQRAGGLGYVGKYDPADFVLAGIRAVAAGTPYGVPMPGHLA